MRNKTKLLLISALSLCTLSAGVTAIAASANEGQETTTNTALELTFGGASIRYAEEGKQDGIRFAIQMSVEDWNDFSESIDRTYVKLSKDGGATWGAAETTSDKWYTVDKDGLYTNVAENIKAYQTTVCLYGDFDAAMDFQVQGFADMKESAVVVQSEVKAENARSMNYVAKEAVESGKVTADKVEAYLPSYTVSFGDYAQAQTVKYGKLAVEPETAPTQEGYVFKGWDYDFTKAVTGNVTVNALWWQEVDQTATNAADLDKSLSTAQTLATASYGEVEKVVYNGEEVPCSIDNVEGTVTFASETVQAFANGLNVVQVWTADKIYSVTVTAATKLIDSEADWNEIYNDTAGYYKLVGDVVFDNTGITVDLHGANRNAANFFGVLDGNNKKISGAKYTNRLFYGLYGTVKDLFLETKLGGVGGAISMGMDKTAVIENVRANITLDSASVWKYTDPFWNADNAGGLVVENWGGLIKDCVVYMDLTNTIDENGKVVADVSTIMTTYTIGGAGAPQNCLSFATTNLWECRDLKNDPGVKKAAFVTIKEMNVGDTWQLREGATSYTAKTENVTVDANGLVTATAGGTATIEAVYNGMTITYTAKIFTPIATAADWLQVYSNPTASYKLTADIDLSGNWADWRDYGYTQDKTVTFTGVIDGNGKTISGITTRLFAAFNGTIKNVTLVGGDSSVVWEGWFGGLLSIDMTGAMVEDVTASVTLYHVCASNNSTLNYTRSAGGLSASINSSTIKNSTINVTIAENISTKYVNAASYPVSAISAWGAGAGNTFVNCTATSNSTEIKQLGTLNN